MFGKQEWAKVFERKGMRQLAWLMGAGALCVVVWLYGYAQAPMQDTKVTPTAPSATGTPAPVTIEGLRTERDQTRMQTMESLTALCADADAAIARMAKEQMLSLTQAMREETTLEVLLRAKGLGPVLAMYEADSVHILTGQSLEAQVSWMAFELISEQTGLPMQCIKLISVEVE